MLRAQLLNGINESKGSHDMAGEVDARLAELGIEVPEAAAPVANYVGYVQSGNLVFVSGQVTLVDGAFKFQGKVGAEFSVEEGQEAARICAINIIAQLKAACGGDLDRVRRIVKLGGFVNSTPEFTDQPKVINGASDLMVAVFGDAGKHTRAAVSAGALPLGVAVEVDAIAEIA
jgi:enamine deaminase RidA (YjgF/YER057c/UK114 family)